MILIPENLKTPDDFADYWLQITYESPGVRFALVDLFKQYEQLIMSRYTKSKYYPGYCYLNGQPVE